MSEDKDLPEGFTLSLALVDAVPVVLFCLSAIEMGRRLGSPLFVVGAVVAFCGGAGKVLWKLLIAVARRNVPVLSRQMRYVMPVGFLLMLAGAIAHGGALSRLLFALVRMPAVVPVLVWLACMVCMGYLARHRQQDSARDNWVEQGVNAVGQAALLVALLLAG